MVRPSPRSRNTSLCFYPQTVDRERDIFKVCPVERVQCDKRKCIPGFLCLGKETRRRNSPLRVRRLAPSRPNVSTPRSLPHLGVSSLFRRRRSCRRQLPGEAVGGTRPSFFLRLPLVLPLVFVSSTVFVLFFFLSPHCSLSRRPRNDDIVVVTTRGAATIALGRANGPD